MKRMALFLGLLGMALGSFSSSANADYCAYDPCEWSSCDGKFIFGADWLYWKMEQSNMNIATLSESVLNSEGIPTATALTELHPKHEFHNGFRVNAGYAMPCNGWELNVSYFNLPSHAKKSAVAEISPDFPLSIPEFIIFNTADFPGLLPGTFFSALDLKWDSNLQNVDVDIARTITFGECFKLRPHIGFRTTWMDQKYRFVAADFTDDLLTTGKLSEKFNGYGVEGGVWASWEIGAGFSVVGHVGGSILYTKYRLHSTTLITVIETDEIAFTLTEKDDLFLGLPSLDYFLGLQYTSNFCDTELSAYVGWEQHAWFDANQLARAGGNLYTQGLTLGVGVAF